MTWVSPSDDLLLHAMSNFLVIFRDLQRKSAKENKLYSLHSLSLFNLRLCLAFVDSNQLVLPLSNVAPQSAA